MPLVFEKTINAAKKAAVWEITEPYVYFTDILGSVAEDGRSERRKLELACSCLLLNHLFGRQVHTQLRKDAFGKPYLEHIDAQVSFSHCRQYVACLLDISNMPAGIDIERIRPNISELSQKFISEKDQAPLGGDTGKQLIWGCKEVLYKIYGKKELDFKRDMQTSYDGLFTGHLEKGEYSRTYTLEYEILPDNLMLVWNI